ncbi:hypothetical protein FFWV33_02915 [Flavobacterium faecale]|uniref:Uncharacterized protein n=1 Tax=Flavobacterium faecale TaxID=1355330 RepID=A0A2S1LAH3_9FLAO|nr:hypothetical protein [Flavobacterium faecale]AWG20556.1 hypothetical protein FFWV33_02915 [Flavobacterium faecale]
MKITKPNHRRNSTNFNRRPKFRYLIFILLALITFFSCNPSEPISTIATTESFAKAHDLALKGQTQKFIVTAGVGPINLTTPNGIAITINGNKLLKNGQLVTGPILIEYIELFDKGRMLVTNKPTMGLLPNGDQKMLISGGEFFVKASQNGVALTTSENMTLLVPTALTNGADQDMTLWTGNLDDTGNLIWAEGVALDLDGSGLVRVGQLTVDQDNYTISIPGFGWTNVDKFYSDPRPKTTILVGAPNGYSNTNSAIYLSYDGEGSNALAKLDTYTAGGLFSEHYGQIPIGLACHIIFVTAENGEWKYAIKAVTIQENAIYQFTDLDTVTATEAQLIAAINAIQ